MSVASLGHVVIRVRDLARAEAFYHGLLGIPISARSDEWSMTFFTLGRHHDFAIVEVGAEAEPPPEGSLGMDHVAFRVEGGDDDLREAAKRLEEAGIEVAPVDHAVTHSLYFRDPDDNVVELYVDTSDAWKEDPSVLLSESRALDLHEKGNP